MAEFTVNGQTVSVGDHHDHLLAALRDELRITSPKDGCSPSGQCGCCTVLIDGKARVSCQTSLEKVAGAEITTLEGVDEAERQRMADTFAAHGALQCGFCTPGMLIMVRDMLRRGVCGTEAAIREELSGNICRCTGYQGIVDSVLLARDRWAEQRQAAE